MTERAWTRGPHCAARNTVFWEIRDADGHQLGDACATTAGSYSEETEARGRANAMLWAAAPDLYEALEATLALVESEYQIDREERADGSHIASSVRPVWLQARAALARARGETL